jgi:hypothetical protein
MTPRRSPKAFPFLPGAAFAASSSAHGLAYLLAFPQGLLRRQVLAETGHSYWAAAVALAMVCALVAGVTTITEHVGRGIRHDRPRNPWQVYRAALVRLAALQSVVFVLQEVLERVRAGAPVSELLHGNFLAIGVAIQLAVALVVALVSRCWASREKRSAAHSPWDRRVARSRSRSRRVKTSSAPGSRSPPILPALLRSAWFPSPEAPLGSARRVASR